MSVGLLLVGGIAALPWLVGVLLDRLAPRVAHRTLPLLAVERARRQRETAAVAVSGVVASLSLAVALTVMVASFRESVTSGWTACCRPTCMCAAPACARAPVTRRTCTPEFVRARAPVPGVQRVQTQRMSSLKLDPAQPPVALIARDLADPAAQPAAGGDAAAGAAGADRHLCERGDGGPARRPPGQLCLTPLAASALSRAIGAGS